ncbi:MAG: IS110 family transposase [Flavobacterium sp.]|nr:IS110 family transposase [Flavobacterium sp.]
MHKNSEFIGIDVSKDTFDVWSPVFGHQSLDNNEKGFKEFQKLTSKNAWCVMESTGSYHQQLAHYLYTKQIQVSVVNPLVVKRFIQMKLQHNKTDKSDAKMIALFGQEQPLDLWVPDPKYIEECKILNTSIALYFKQSTALKNKLHSLESKGSKGIVLQSLKRQIKQFQKEISILETRVESLIKEHESEMLTNISSISGIGKKTAMMLISNTYAFKSFDHYTQVSAYFGLSPIERTSGSSIRGRSRISKKGNPAVRNHLFMCSFTACQYNPQCKALYERIVAKGKSKKLALIAVCNKLLKQSFAIAKSGIPYDPKYRSRPVFQ